MFLWKTCAGYLNQHRRSCMADINLWIALKQSILYNIVDFQGVFCTRRLHLASSIWLCVRGMTTALDQSQKLHHLSDSTTQHGLMHDLLLGVKGNSLGWMETVRAQGVLKSYYGNQVPKLIEHLYLDHIKWWALTQWCHGPISINKQSTPRLSLDHWLVLIPCCHCNLITCVPSHLIICPDPTCCVLLLTSFPL